MRWLLPLSGLIRNQLPSVHGAKAAILRNVRISPDAILSELKIADDRCQQRLLPDFSMAFTLAVVSKRPATVEVDVADLAEWFAKVRMGAPRSP